MAEALLRVMPEVKPVFLCTTRPIDAAMLEPTGYRFFPQPIIPPKKSVGGLLRFWKSWRETKDLLSRLFDEHRPAAVIGLGGYAAGVAVKMGAQRGLPTLILNPDVIPGKANQYLMRHVRAVCCQFDATRNYCSSTNQSKLRFTGCPIRSDIARLPPEPEALKRLGLESRLHTLVVTGASQGAATVNEAVLESLRSIKLQGWQILHLSGKEHAQAVREGYRELKMPATVVDFTPAMADVWSVADLAISRSGASSCAELTVCGVPSMLMPYPFHKDMHQRANAQVLADARAAVLLDDEKDRKKNAARLLPALESLLYDAPKRHAMSTAARSLGRPDASEAVAKVVTELLDESR